MSRVLLVEDDEFKASDLARTISLANPAAVIERAASVTSALRAIAAGSYELVVLDMSLPTFDISGPGGGGSPEGQGGLEVLRLARRLSNKSPFVIVTQYPDIDIDGREFSLSQATQKLSALFTINVVACLLYEFDKDDWRDPFSHILRSVGEKF